MSAGCVYDVDGKNLQEITEKLSQITDWWEAMFSAGRVRVVVPADNRAANALMLQCVLPPAFTTSGSAATQNE